METLHRQFFTLKADLAKDEIALAWFDLGRNLSGEPSTPSQPGFPSSLPADDPFTSFDTSPNAEMKKYFRFPG